MSSINGKHIEDQELLIDILEKGRVNHRRYALIKRTISGCLVVIVFSVGAMILTNIATKWFTADEVSSLAGLGALILALHKYGRFQDQAKWNKLKQRNYERLSRQLVFEEKSISEVSANLSDTNDELEKVRAWLDAPEDFLRLIGKTKP